MFRNMIKMGSHRLNKNVDFINSLNVFPVPDGDTGTNMNLTFQSGAKFVNESDSMSVGDLAVLFSKGLLMGARGNSGVISSQIFRGFQKSISKKETLDAKQFAAALQQGVESAYKAVMKPVEGTILTVAKYAAHAALEKSSQSDDLAEVMEEVVKGAKEGLKLTPELLPILKEVGVVDSGGQGLVFLYEGFLNAIKGEGSDDTYTPSDEQMNEMVNAAHHQSVQSQLATNDIEYGYCTEMMITLNQEKDFDLNTFRSYLDQLGNSLLAVSDDEVAKVHIHTESPEKVFRYGAQFGQLEKIKIDNMRLQHETIIEDDENSAKNDKITTEIIAVAQGKGLIELMRSLGATRVITGGQTMNPSTEDFLKILKRTKAKNAIILPNNGNVLMTAQAAANAVSLPVEVISTKSIQQGISALFAYGEENSLAENAEMMREGITMVKSGEVTNAVRDTKINGLAIKKGDFMGIVDGEIVTTAENRIQAAIKLIDQMLEEDSEIVSIFYGIDAAKREAVKIESEIQNKYPDLELEIHAGDQAVYPYLISVE
ncbi:DAK2 domain-containing protein [Xylocopilactobacillus apicola]|nr:DAK2 domain-containing protein [Xylocopilactobacillus apicola]